MKYVVVTGYNQWITEAETIADACEQFDWKYPGTVIAVAQLPNDANDICPLCGADMRGREDG